MCTSPQLKFLCFIIFTFAVACEDSKKSQMSSSHTEMLLDEQAMIMDDQEMMVDDQEMMVDDQEMIEEARLPPGLDDDFAQTACELLNAPPMSIIATDRPSEAGQVTLLPNENSAFSVRLPESGIGYLTLEVPDWSITVGLFTHYTQSVQVATSLGDFEVVGPLSQNASCSEFTDERLHFHSWGSYVAELRGEPSSELQLALLKRQ